MCCFVFFKLLMMRVLFCFYLVFRLNKNIYFFLMYEHFVNNKVCVSFCFVFQFQSTTQQ